MLKFQSFAERDVKPNIKNSKLLISSDDSNLVKSCDVSKLPISPDNPKLLKLSENTNSPISSDNSTMQKSSHSSKSLISFNNSELQKLSDYIKEMNSSQTSKMNRDKLSEIFRKTSTLYNDSLTHVSQNADNANNKLVDTDKNQHFSKTATDQWLLLNKDVVVKSFEQIENLLKKGQDDQDSFKPRKHESGLNQNSDQNLNFGPNPGFIASHSVCENITVQSYDNQTISQPVPCRNDNQHFDQSRYPEQVSNTSQYLEQSRTNPEISKTLGRPGPRVPIYLQEFPRDKRYLEPSGIYPEISNDSEHPEPRVPRYLQEFPRDRGYSEYSPRKLKYSRDSRDFSRYSPEYSRNFVKSPRRRRYSGEFSDSDSHRSPKRRRCSPGASDYSRSSSSADSSRHHRGYSRNQSSRTRSNSRESPTVSKILDTIDLSSDSPSKRQSPKSSDTSRYTFNDSKYSGYSRNPANMSPDRKSDISNSSRNTPDIVLNRRKLVFQEYSQKISDIMRPADVYRENYSEDNSRVSNKSRESSIEARFSSDSSDSESSDESNTIQNFPKDYVRNRDFWETSRQRCAELPDSYRNSSPNSPESASHSIQIPMLPQIIPLKDRNITFNLQKSSQSAEKQNFSNLDLVMDNQPGQMRPRRSSMLEKALNTTEFSPLNQEISDEFDDYEPSQTDSTSNMDLEPQISPINFQKPPQIERITSHVDQFLTNIRQENARSRIPPLPDNAKIPKLPNVKSGIPPLPPLTESILPLPSSIPALPKSSIPPLPDMKQKKCSKTPEMPISEKRIVRYKSVTDFD